MKLVIFLKKYNSIDTESLINNIKDSIVGVKLGYDSNNILKHGFDCKKTKNNIKYLEVKSANYNSMNWNAIFNDTTIEKAEMFKDKDVFLALAIWKDYNELLFVVYGQDKNLGIYLIDKVKNFLNNNENVRSTQTISISQLINEYNFDIICISKTKDEVKNILANKNKNLFSINDNKFLTIDEYYKKYNMEKVQLVFDSEIENKINNNSELQKPKK